METEEIKGRQVTPNIVLGTDGKYHWYYEFKLMKNPTILFLLWKMFFWISFGIYAMLLIFDLFGGHMHMDDFLGATKAFLLITAVMEALTLLGYLVYAALQGFKYCVMFEMDDQGVTHTQMPKQFKKAQAASAMLIFMGIAAGKPGAVGTGILSGSKNSSSSTWAYVKSVEIFRKRGVIKVNERLNYNQVYAKKEDFQFVEDFITSHVTKKCSVEYKL